jgi:hypothetical protein
MHEEKCVRKTDPGGCVVVRLLDVRYGRRRSARITTNRCQPGAC